MTWNKALFDALDIRTRMKWYRVNQLLQALGLGAITTHNGLHRCVSLSAVRLWALRSIYRAVKCDSTQHNSVEWNDEKISSIRVQYEPIYDATLPLWAKEALNWPNDAFGESIARLMANNRPIIQNKCIIVKLDQTLHTFNALNGTHSKQILDFFVIYNSSKFKWFYFSLPQSREKLTILYFKKKYLQCNAPKEKLSWDKEGNGVTLEEENDVQWNEQIHCRIGPNIQV